MRTLVERLCLAAENRSLSIGEAWNLIDEAADRIEVADRLAEAADDVVEAGRTDIEDGAVIHALAGALGNYWRALDKEEQRG